MGVRQKIVYVMEHPYSICDHHRFGADYLMSQGYDVEIWRVISSKSVFMDFSIGMYRAPNYREYTKEDFYNVVKNTVDETLFILRNIDETLVPLVSENRQYILLMGLGAIPEPSVKELNMQATMKSQSRIQHIWNTLKTKGVVGYIKQRHVKNQMMMHQKKIKNMYSKYPPLFIVTSTKFAADRYLSRIDYRFRILYIHAMDYDRFIETNRKETVEGITHILYCDSGLFHRSQDQTILHINNMEQYEEIYYCQLERLFSILESHYRLPVVIAGHPHVIYEKGAFNNRDIIYNETCELTKNAALFITTTSTATNFALLYNVPILKIANRYLKSLEYPYEGFPDAYAYIRYEAENVFGCGFLDLNDDYAMEHPWDCVRQIDDSLRSSYLNQYVIDNSTSEKTIIEYIEEELQNLGK